MNHFNEFFDQIQTGSIEFDHKESSEFVLLVSGDFCPIGRAEEQCLSGRVDEIFSEIMPLLKQNEIAITNLECPLTLSDRGIKKTGPLLKAHPNCVEALKNGNFNVVNLANNHILDYGEAGLLDTLKICQKNNIHTVGAGINQNEAAKPLYIKIKNKLIALINVTEHEFSIARPDSGGANLLNPIQNFYHVLEARKKADYLVVIVHGGNEHIHFPGPGLVDIFRFFADIGANAVIGHHPHCPGGVELYNNTPLIYSLGNFVFDWPDESFAPWFEGFIVRLHFSESGVSRLDFHPYEQYRSKPSVFLLEGFEKKEFLRKIARFSKVIADPEELQKEWRELKLTRKHYLSTVLNLNRVEKYLLKQGWFNAKILKKKKLLRILNILRCQSHRELAIKIIENEICERE